LKQGFFVCESFSFTLPNPPWKTGRECILPGSKQFIMMLKLRFSPGVWADCPELFKEE